MKKTYTGKDKYGSYTLSFEDNILYAQIKGAVGQELAKRYNRDFCHLCDQHKSLSWAFFAKLSACEGYTQDASEVLSAPHRYAKEKGCVAEAYHVSSPLLIDQLAKIRQLVGLSSPLKAHIFSTERECVTYLKNHPRIINHQSNKV
jgi:hypothetical protein